jgi:acetyl esterase/lipase
MEVSPDVDDHDSCDIREKHVDRRAFLLAAVAGLAGARLSQAQAAVLRPIVSEKVCPLETIAPVAADGYRGVAVLRKPPGPGPFPVVVWLHGGISTVPVARLEGTARDLALGSRLLAAGYVCVAPTYRSRDVDLQSNEPTADALAVVEYLRTLPVVDRQSIVVGGCSGGGDLALEVASRTRVCAVVAEEPATVLMTGVFNNSVPRRSERYTPEDGFFLLEDGRRYYTAELQKAFRAKLATLDAPIMIVQGDVGEGPIDLDGPGRNRFNAEVLIPELRATGKRFDVKSYHGQAHCFCSASGAPRPGGRSAPASWPAAALRAFEDIDAFCRRHVATKPRALDAGLVTFEPVRTGPITGGMR